MSRIYIQYGWVIVFAAFLITFVTCGVNNSYGVFFLPIIGEFGWSRGQGSIVMLVAGLTYALTMPITGILADRYGYKLILTISVGIQSAGLVLSSLIQNLWQFYIFDGLLIGMSMSASFAIPVSLIALWFIKRQGLAVGLATVGVSLGTAVVPLLITYLIGGVGWRNTFFLAGLAVAVVCIPAALLTRRPNAVELHPAGSVTDRKEEAPTTRTRIALDMGLTAGQAFRTHQFWMLFTAFLFFLLGVGLVMLHLVPYAIDSGMTPVAGASLFLMIGLFGMPGRFMSGLISDRLGVKPVILVCLLILALGNAWVAFNDQSWTFYALAAVFGAVYSGFVTQMVCITQKIFGFRALGSIFGTLMISDGIGLGVGPWVAGYIFDLTGSYQISFLSVAVGLVLAAILIIIVKPAHKPST